MWPTPHVFEMTALDHILAAIICIVAPAMAVASRRAQVEDVAVLEKEDKISLYHQNSLLLIMLSLVVITVWRIPDRTLFQLGFSTPIWSSVVLWLILGITLLYGIDLFFQFGRKKWRQKAIESGQGAISFIPVDAKEFFHFIGMALAAGFGEEIIFRGFLMHYLLYWTGVDIGGVVAACIFCSALFAFLHGYQGWQAMIKIFFFALLFVAIMLYTKSLVVVIIIHALIDIVSGWIGVMVLRESNSNS